MLNPQQQKVRKIIFSEDVLSYCLYRNCIPNESRIFFKISHNIDIKTNRIWSYWCSPEVDLIEVMKNNTITGYELKGARLRKGTEEFPAFYDGIGQAIAYLNLPFVYENNQFKFGGGVFDFVYVVYARNKIEFPEHEKKIFNLLPIGVILALPDGKFEKVKEAPKNPLQNREAKEHFLNNLDTLKRHSTNSRIFRKIKETGERYFSNLK